MTSSSTLLFPTPVLTPIVGAPTNTTLQLLQKEVFSNAMAIESDRGGGQLGHLALIMSPADYLELPNAEDFVVPVNPGILELAPAGTPAAMISDLKRVHDNDRIEFGTYRSVRNALIAQLTAAVEPTYFAAIQDEQFGFARLMPRDLLAHLVTQYGTLTGVEREQNRAKLGDAWDPASPIEQLWARIAEIKRVSAAAGQPLDDTTVIALVLPMFSRTGLFLHAVNTWRGFEVVDQTYDRFVVHFTRHNKIRIEELTSADLKFADANFSTTATAVNKQKPAVTPPRVSTDVAGTPTMYYCWSHGLSEMSVHTSASCRQPKEGHIATATWCDRKGGSNIFRSKEDRPRGPRTSTGSAAS